jgi:type I restriction enzyme M protein
VAASARTAADLNLPVTRVREAQIEPPPIERSLENDHIRAINMRTHRMTLSLNKPKLDNLAGDIWKSAERLRGKFKAYEYQSVILPIIVIRRLECVLIAWRAAKRAEVLAKRPDLPEQKLAELVKGMELGTAPFSNKTDWTLRKVYEEDHALLEANFRAYINGFSKNVDEIIEHFNYRATIGQMVKNNRLAPILSQYKELELGPDKLSPLEMGYIYEELDFGLLR